MLVFIQKFQLRVEVGSFTHHDTLINIDIDIEISYVFLGVTDFLKIFSFFK